MKKHPETKAIDVESSFDPIKDEVYIKVLGEFNEDAMKTAIEFFMPTGKICTININGKMVDLSE